MTETWSPDDGGSGAAAGPPTAAATDGSRAYAALVAQLSGVVLGDGAALRVAATTFLAGGHVLFEDSPGVGKTLLAKALAGSVGGTFGRVQGTPDLLPSDLTGISYLDDETRSWVFRPGPLFNNVVLVDELNRATPRTQSALLEAMAEGQVTVDGTTHQLPDPFFVVATQNPVDLDGECLLGQAFGDRGRNLGAGRRRPEPTLAAVGKGDDNAALCDVRGVLNCRCHGDVDLFH